MTDVLLDVRGLSKSYRLPGGASVEALHDVSFQLRRGEILGLVGESGSGKSSALRCIMGLLRPDEGTILYQGVNVWDSRQKRRNRELLQSSRQIVFQDSASCLNPRMNVAQLIAEPLAVHRKKLPYQQAVSLLSAVGLDAACLKRFPGELSGGQRQRVAIARALSAKPALLAADEPIAALDVSIQAQILNLFRRLQHDRGFSILFVAHDLAVVRWFCHRTAVLCRGRLVELAPTEALFRAPGHPYTKALLSAIPIPDPRRERARMPISFDLEDFQWDGTLREAEPEHFVLC